MPNYNFDDDSDSESYESFDDESEMDNIMYEPEEQSLTKYNIVICVKYKKEIHGFVDGEINNHFLTLGRLKEFNLLYIDNIYQFNIGNVEIAECFYLPSGDCISIIKTHWLKIIQRVWKKIYNERKIIINIRCNINSLKYREIFGKWPNNCINFPQLKGMLYKLSRSSS